MTRSRTVGALVTALFLPAMAVAQGANAKAAPGSPTADHLPIYEVDPTWPPTLPNDWILGDIRGLFVDDRDHLWIIHMPSSLTPQEIGAAVKPPIADCCIPAPPVLELVKNSTLKRYEYITLLAGIILAGWKTVDITTGERYVTNEEMRDILVADEGFRSSLLWHLERSSNAQEEYQHWAKQVFIFLNEIWPRQKKVKTPRMTAKLVKFALSSPDLFPEVIDAILPLLTKIDETTRHHLLRLEDKTVKKHPKKTLALLSAILPENASIWPYGIEDVLEMVGIAEPHLLNDPRLVELKRQWNSR